MVCAGADASVLMPPGLGCPANHSPDSGGEEDGVADLADIMGRIADLLDVGEVVVDPISRRAWRVVVGERGRVLLVSLTTMVGEQTLVSLPRGIFLRLRGAPSAYSVEVMVDSDCPATLVADVVHRLVEPHDRVHVRCASALLARAVSALMAECKVRVGHTNRVLRDIRRAARLFTFVNKNPDGFVDPPRVAHAVDFLSPRALDGIESAADLIACTGLEPHPWRFYERRDLMIFVRGLVRDPITTEDVERVRYLASDFSRPTGMCEVTTAESVRAALAAAERERRVTRKYAPILAVAAYGCPVGGGRGFRFGRARPDGGIIIRSPGGASFSRNPHLRGVGAFLKSFGFAWEMRRGISDGKMKV